MGHSLFELGNRQWDIRRLRELLETVLPENTSFESVVVDHDFPDIGHRKMILNGRRIRSDEGEPQFILLAIESAGPVLPKKSGRQKKG